MDANSPEKTPKPQRPKPAETGQDGSPPGVVLRQLRGHGDLSDDPEVLAALYAECAEEDRLLAEEGMADHAEQLATEDFR